MGILELGVCESSSDYNREQTRKEQGELLVLLKCGGLMFVEKRYATVVISRYVKLENMREREREIASTRRFFFKVFIHGGWPVVIESLEKSQVHVLGRF